MSAPTADSDTNPGKAPKPLRTRRRRRRVLRWLGWAVALVGVLLALSYVAPVQRFAFDAVAARLERQAGIVLRADRTTFDAIRLRASMDGVSIASRQTPSVPYFTAAHVDLDAPSDVLRGRPVLRRIRVVDGSVDMSKVASGGPGGGPFRGLGSLQVGEVSVENFSFFVGTPDSARVTIRNVSMKGTGNAPGRLQLESVAPGTLVFEIGDARLPFDALNASFVVDGDRLTINHIVAQSNTARAELHGTARFDRGYPIEVDYQASVDLPRAADWWAITDSTLKGTSSLSGHLSGPLISPTTTVRADTTGFEWRTLSRGRLVANGWLTGPGIKVDAFTLTVPEVTARGKGFLSWSDETPLSSLQATWRSALLRRLGPLVELDPETIPLVAAQGTANVTWPGFVPDLGKLAGTLQTHVASSHPDGDDHGTIDMTGGDTRWRVNWRQSLPGDTTASGQFDVRINPALFARSSMSGTLDVTAPDIAPAITRAALLDISVPESALTRLQHGRAVLTGPIQGTVAMPQWHATLEATDVVMSGLRDITVNGTFRVDPDWFVTDNLTVRAPGSTVRVTGTIGVLQDDSDVSFDGSVDAAWASAPFAPAAWPVNGLASIAGTWMTRKDVDDMDVTFESPAVTLAGQPTGPVRGKLHSGLLAMAGDLSVPDLGSRFSGTYDLTEALAHTARAEFTQADAARWLRLGGTAPDLLEDVHLTLDGTVEASGSFETPDTTDVTVRLDALSGTIRARPVLLAAPTVVRWNRGSLDAGTSTIAVGGATIAVTPDGADASTITLASPLSDLLALLPPESVPATIVADGGLRVVARVPHADPRHPSLHATATIVDITKDTTHVAHGVHAEASLEKDRILLSALTGTVLGATLNASGSAPVEWFVPALASSPGAPSKPAPAHEARFSGTIDAPVAEVLNALDVRTKDLSGAARISFDLAASGMTVNAVRGTVTAESLAVQTGTGAFTNDGPGRVRVENGRVFIDEFSLKSADSRVKATGQVDLNPGGAIDVRLTGTTSMSLVDALVTPRVEGTADVELHVGGTTDRPDLDGVLTLHNVSALTQDARLVLADLDGQVTFKPGRIESVDIKGQLNGGTLAITGSMALNSPRPGDGVRLIARDLFVEYPTGLKNRVSADLTFVGGRDAPEIRGSTTFLTDPYRESLPRMAQLLAAFSEPSTTSSAESPGPLGRVALDVALLSAMPLRLDNSLGKIELTPHLRLVGTVDSPALSGRVDIADDGRIVLQSRTYALSDSRMDFNPDDGFVPRLQIVGTTKVGDYVVTLRVSGPADAIEMNLSSDPPLSERDLQGLLLTGQAADSDIRDTGSENFALTALSSDLLGIAGQAIGLDTVRIGSESFELVSSDVTPTTRLTVGKTLMGRFDLVYSENLDDNTATWIVGYRPRSGLEFRVSSRDNLTKVVEFRHQFAFGPGGTRTADTDAARKQPRASAPVEVVETVTILGESLATMARLRPLLKLTQGKVFDYTRWIADHERLRRFYAVEGFLTARIVPTRTLLDPPGTPRSRVTLEYRITPGPATSIVVSGFPVDEPDRQRLRDAWTTTTFDQFAANDISRAAREMLFDRGYVTPVVKTLMSTPAPGQLVATVEVQAGPLPKSRAVGFDGMTIFTELDLAAIAVETGTAEGAWRDPGALCFAISRAYAAVGYRNAEVVADPVRFTGTDALLPIRIVEGQPTKVGRVLIHGVGDARRAGAVSAAEIAPGSLLAMGEDRAARLRLERHFRNLGFRNATVAVRVGAPGRNGRIDITFTVSEGRLQVVQGIRVEGARTTRPSLIQQAIMLKPGEPAEQNAVAETERRLYRLGVFNAADVRLVPAVRLPSEPAFAPGVMPVNAIVSVTEPRRFQFLYGIEFANDYGPVFEDFENSVGGAADVRDRNFLGRGMSLSVGGRYEQNLQSLRALFAVPRLRSLPVRTNVFLSWKDETQDLDGLLAKTVSRRASIEQRWRARPWMDLSWGYSISNESYKFPDYREYGELLSSGVLASVNGSVLFDRRDNAMDTKRGWFHSSSFQQGSMALGSDLNYSRYLGRAFGFFSVGRLVSASAIRVGGLWNASGTAPLETIDLLFHTGGSQTVRGYAQDQLSGPLVDGYPLGGTRLLVLNQELRFSVFSKLQFVAFADAGNVFDNRIVLRDLAAGLGAGVRIITPLAPLRFDFAFPVPRLSGDKKYRWYFSVGHIF